MSQAHIFSPRSESRLLFIPQVVAAATSLASATNYLVFRAAVKLRVWAAHINVRSPIDATATTPGKFEFRRATAINNATAIAETSRQQETATAAGTITVGVLQVETATAAGNVSTSGNATVTVTAAGMTGSPVAVTVALLDTDDDGSAIAAKIRTALGLNANVAAFFTVSGATDKVILTTITAAANDATLNIAIANDTSVGVATAATSANTTAGVAPGTGNASVVVTGAALAGSPKTISVAVVAGDTAATWAGKVRTALAADDNVAAAYTVSGSSTAIILTAIENAANDTSLNISLANGTSTGITTAATSANTTGGVANASGSFPGVRLTIQPGSYGSNDEDQGLDGFTLEPNEALFIRCIDIGNNGTPAGLDVTLTVGFA